MSKIKKIIISAAIAILLVIVGVGIFVKSYLSGDRLKAFIIPRIEEATGRKVALRDIKLSIFKGVVVSDLKVLNVNGEGAFLKADKFILAYEPFALLGKRFVISRIEIVSPLIDIKRNANGTYNFEEGRLGDKKTKTAEKEEAPAKTSKKALPVSVVADRILIKSARITFSDEKNELPQTSLMFDAELKCSLANGLTPVMEKGSIKLKELKSAVNKMGIQASGLVDIDMKEIKSKLNIKAGKNAFVLDGTVTDYLGLPNAKLDITAREMNINELIVAMKSDKTHEKKTKNVHAAASKMKQSKAVKKTDDAPAKKADAPKFKASGQIQVETALYEKYVVKNFRATYLYNNGNVRIEPFAFSFSGGDSVKTEGAANGKIQFNYGDAAHIKKSLISSAKASLGKGSISGSKTFDMIALLTGAEELKKPGFDNGTFSFDVQKEIVNVDGFVVSNLMRFSPKGSIDFNKKLNMNAELKLSPQLSANISRKIPGVSLLKSSDGWTTIPLTITGTTDDPSISIDKKLLGSQFKDGTKGLLQNLIGPQKTDKKTDTGKSGSRGLFDQLLGR